MKVLISDVIIVDGGKALLVQQRKQSAFGLWGLPGGHVEEGETPGEAVLREVQEELGLMLLDAKLLETYTLNTPEGELEMRTYVGSINGNVVLKDDELMAYGWFSLDSLKDMQHKLRTPGILERISAVLDSNKTA
ncbi:MAG TPA: NUDIX hydrolase [Candidatus Saccharimonadales bacterium]